MPIQDTSREARDSRAEYADAVDERIMRHFRRKGAHGCTDDELERELNLLHQTASACRRNLVKAGKICETDERRKTRTGRNAIVWKLRAFASNVYGGNPRACPKLLNQMLTWPRTCKGVVWPVLPEDLEAEFQRMKRRRLTERPA